MICARTDIVTEERSEELIIVPQIFSSVRFSPVCREHYVLQESFSPESTMFRPGARFFDVSPEHHSSNPAGLFSVRISSAQRHIIPRRGLAPRSF